MLTLKIKLDGHHCTAHSQHAGDYFIISANNLSALYCKKVPMLVQKPSMVRRPRYSNSDQQCFEIFIKEFSKMDYENRPICEIDWNLIASDEKCRIYFDRCLSELELMASTEFCASHSFYSLINRSISIKKLARFSKNDKLVSKFEGNVQRFHY